MHVLVYMAQKQAGVPSQFRDGVTGAERQQREGAISTASRGVTGVGRGTQGISGVQAVSYFLVLVGFPGVCLSVFQQSMDGLHGAL